MSRSWFLGYLVCLVVCLLVGQRADRLLHSARARSVDAHSIVNQPVSEVVDRCRSEVCECADSTVRAPIHGGNASCRKCRRCDESRVWVMRRIPPESLCECLHQTSFHLGDVGHVGTAEIAVFP